MMRRSRSQGQIRTAVVAIAVALSLTYLAPAAGETASGSPGPDLTSAALVADRGITIDRGVAISGGVLVREPATAPFLTTPGANLTIDRDTHVTGDGSWVVADSIHAARGTTLANAAFNTAVLDGTVLGTSVSPYAFPVPRTGDPVPVGATGTENVVLPRDTSAALEPGAYGELHIGRGTRLTLSDGQYWFTSVVIDREVIVNAAPGTEVVVTGRATIDRGVQFAAPSVAEGDPLPKLTVLGSDASSTAPLSGPALTVGRDSVVTAHVSAPSGTAAFDRGLSLTGSVDARWIAIGRDSRIEYRENPGPPQDDVIVQLEEPRHGSTVTGEVALRASVSGIEIERVVFEIDGYEHATDLSEPFEAVWDSALSAAGDHQLVVVAIDVTGAIHRSHPVTVLADQPLTPGQQLERDRETGVISAEDYARYAVFRWFEPESVPERYREAELPVDVDLTIAMIVALAELRTFDDEVQQELVKYLLPPGGSLEPASPMTAEEVWDALDFVIEVDPDEVESLGTPVESYSEDGGTLPTPVDEERTPSEAPETPEVATGPTSDSIPDDGRQAAHAEPLATGQAIDIGGPTLVEAPSTVTTAAPPHGPIALKRGTMSCGTIRSWEYRDVRLDFPTACVYETRLADFHFLLDDGNAGQHGIAGEDRFDVLLLDDPDEQARPNGIPDEIDVRVEAFYQATSTYLEMGYESIPKQQVVIANFGGGMSLPVISTIFLGKSSPVYLVRHELFHQYQYRYINLLALAADYAGIAQTSTGWWLEATAEWAAHQAQIQAWGTQAQSDPFVDDIGDYSEKIGDHLNFPNRPLTLFLTPIDKSAGVPQYGSFLFVEFLEQYLYRAGVWDAKDFVRQVWEESIQEAPIFVVERLLREQHGLELATAVAQYHQANYAIVPNYSDPDARTWGNTLVDRRPARNVVELHPGDTYHNTVEISAGGAVYLDLIAGSMDPDGVTFDVDIRAYSGDKSLDSFEAHLVYIDDTYPTHCYPMDTRDLEPTARGAGLEVLTISPSCPQATLIISNRDAAAAQRLFFESPLRNQYDPTGVMRSDLVVDVQVHSIPTDNRTVVEHRGHGLLHHRVNSGPDLDRWVHPSEEYLDLSIDLGDAISTGRRIFSLNLYGNLLRSSTLEIVVNGESILLEHRRFVSPPDGRYRNMTAYWWGVDGLSTFQLPDGVLRDGMNTFRIPVADRMLLHGAYIESYPPALDPPDPDPDPVPCPDCPVLV